MGWLRHLLGGDDHDPVADKEKGAEVERTIHASNVASRRAERAIADYRHADDVHRQAAVMSREAGERLIEEVEDR